MTGRPWRGRRGGRLSQGQRTSSRHFLWSAAPRGKSELMGASQTLCASGCQRGIAKKNLVEGSVEAATPMSTARYVVFILPTTWGVYYSTLMGEGTNSTADGQEPSWSLVGRSCQPHPKPSLLFLQHFKLYLSGRLCARIQWDEEWDSAEDSAWHKTDDQWLLYFWVINNRTYFSLLKWRMNLFQVIR